MNDFRPGQRVICVVAPPHWEMTGVRRPEVGRVYTVKRAVSGVEAANGTPTNVPCVLLEEIHNPRICNSGFTGLPVWEELYFAEIAETRIDVFRQLLVVTSPWGGVK